MFQFESIHFLSDNILRKDVKYLDGGERLKLLENTLIIEHCRLIWQ